MLILVAGGEKTQRYADIQPFIQEGVFSVFDDTMTSFDELESFAYPSLFETSAPIIWGKFLLDKEKEDGIPADKIKVLAKSNTIFIIEEFAVAADTKKLFEKHGAHIFVQKKIPKGKEGGAIFSIVETLIDGDKKTRWLAYQKALAQEFVPEALIGIMYWKLRQLIGYARGEKRDRYIALYRTYINAHSAAWKQGTPMVLVIEKILLQE